MAPGGMGGPMMGGPGMGGMGGQGMGAPPGGLGATQALPGTDPRGLLAGPSFGAPPPGGLGGMSMGMNPMGQPMPMNGPAAPMFGQPPAFGQGPHAPTAAFPVLGAPPAMTPHAVQASQPQSQVETALSLPRPDPAALWLAHQEAAAGQSRRNTGVLVAVGLLTALCVVGIGTLFYFKYYSASANPTGDTPGEVIETPRDEPAETDDAEPTGDSGEQDKAAPPGDDPAESPEASEGDKDEASADAPPTDKPGDVKAGSGTATNPATGADPDAEPGLLTIVCTPFCDDVLDNGRSLGPSPIVQVPVPPGQHRITLKRAGQSQKTISVIVVSGEVTAQRVSMK